MSHSSVGFWVVHIPLFRMYKFFAQFPVDDLLYPVESSLLLFCANLLHLLIFIVDRFVYHHITYICYFVTSHLLLSSSLLLESIISSLSDGFSLESLKISKTF